MPSDAQGKIYPQFLRIKPGQLLVIFVRPGAHGFRDFAARVAAVFYLWWSHTGTGCSGTKNKNDKFQHQESEVEQQPYLSSKYEKAQQDVGLFLFKKIILNSICYYIDWFSCQTDDSRQILYFYPHQGTIGQFFTDLRTKLSVKTGYPSILFLLTQLAD